MVDMVVNQLLLWEYGQFAVHVNQSMALARK